MRTQSRKNHPQLGKSIPRGATATRQDSHRQAPYRETVQEPRVIAELQDKGATANRPASEELLSAQADLAGYLITMAPTVLTARQWSVLSLWLTGRYTQQQIADALGIAQTTVCKTLNGNDAYFPDGCVSRYGGVIRRMQVWAETDPEAQRQLAHIREIVENEC